jgi:KUP system potassium uptake protein
VFFGDSMITPAISVLSAVEGVKVAAPSVSDLILPITAAIIVCLFLVQRFGAGAVGRLFGPVMAVWFAAIGAFGAHGIIDHPEILKALSPSYALGFLFGHFSTAPASGTAICSCGYCSPTSCQNRGSRPSRSSSCGAWCVCARR